MTQAAKAKRYAAIKYWLVGIDLALTLGLLVAAQGSGFAHLLAVLAELLGRSPWGIVAVYWLIGYTLFTLVTFPLDLYAGFFLEHQFDLSRQTFAQWLKDELKQFLLSLALSLILVEGFYALLRAAPAFWWFWAACGWFGVTVILSRILPTIIIPLFYKYFPIQDTALKERLLALCRRLKVKVVDIYGIKLGEKTVKANAALVGVGKSRRIVIGDTLLERYTPEEIEVVLAHELGHHALGHLWRLIGTSAASALVGFYLLHRFTPWLLRWIHVASLAHVEALPAIAVALTVLSLLLLPLQNGFSRRLEWQADHFALQLTGLRSPFISCMEKLAEQNLADRSPHPLIEWLLYDHPSITHRIAWAKQI